MKNLSMIFTGVLATIMSTSPTLAADGKIDPSKGYTFSQTVNLTKRFDLKTWNVDGPKFDIDVARFVYLNTPRFFRHAAIERQEPILPIVSQPSSSIGKIKVKMSKGEMTLEEWAAGHLDGIIVVHNGVIVFERYPRMRVTDRHIWWSVSKSVAGTLVGLLEAKGLVNVSRPIETYIPEMKSSGWARTPVIDILDMASGMSGLEADNPEAYTNPDSPYGKFEGSLGLQPATKNTPVSTYAYIPTLKRLKKSGVRNEYTSVNTFTLGWLVEKVTGLSYAEAVSQLIWQKMGAEADGMIIVSPTGANGAHGLINSTLRDLARYGMLFTDASPIDKGPERTIPRSLIQKIQSGGRPEIYKNGLAKKQFDGYLREEAAFQTRQWDFVTTDGDFAKAGFHGQTLYISPSKNLVVASFATGQKYDTFTFARAISKSLK